MAANNTQIIKYFDSIFQEATNAKVGIHTDWRENLSLYNDQYEFPNKLDWQTKARDPIIDNLVTRMSNFFTKILVSSDDDYYDVDHKESVKGDGLVDVAKAVFNDNNFPLIFNDTFKTSLLTSPYINKVSYKFFLESFPTFNEQTGEFGTTEEKVGRTVIEAKDPFKVHLDPNGDSYIIDEDEIDLYAFEIMARANGWTNIDRLIVESKKNTGSDDPNHRPTVKLFEVYTKAITSTTGALLEQNIHFIIAQVDSQKVVVFKEPNLLPRGKFPYVVGFPMKVVTGRYGRGYISKLKSIILAYRF